MFAWYSVSVYVFFGLLLDNIACLAKVFTLRHYIHGALSIPPTPPAVEHFLSKQL